MRRTNPLFPATVATLLLLTLPGPVPAGDKGRGEAPRRPEVLEAPAPTEGRSLRYRVTARSPRLNRRLMGPVERWVQGVPAEPVDSMCWNGVGSVPIEGTFVMDVEPMKNVGRVQARWRDENGTWGYRQTQFIHPEHHSSGVRMGSTVTRIESVINEAMAHNVYLHGDTAAGMPVLPTVFTYLAAWGPANVTLNGEEFRNPFEIPAPRWLGHLMVTEGVRQPDGTVRTLSGQIYDPSKAHEGVVDPGDIEVHLTFHDDLFPNTGNIPPPFSFFYHLVFEDVTIEMLQADGPDDAGF